MLATYRSRFSLDRRRWQTTLAETGKKQGQLAFNLNNASVEKGDGVVGSECGVGCSEQSAHISAFFVRATGQLIQQVGYVRIQHQSHSLLMHRFSFFQHMPLD